MKLSNVLGKIQGTDSEKTASVAAPAAKPAPEKTASASADALKTALHEAQASIAAPAEKQAATGSPVADLMKTASQIAGAEHEALTKEAMVYGAAVCDGFMARFAQYNEAAEKIAAQRAPEGVKTASAGDTFEKFAAENPQLVKQAAEMGYTSAGAQLEKLASQAYEKGYNVAVEGIYKLANGSFCQGYEDTLRMVAEARK